MCKSNSLKRFYIMVNDKPWYISIYLKRDVNNIYDVAQALLSIGISRENLKIAMGNLTSGQMNNGITFSSAIHRETISIWGFSTSPSEAFNLYCHEMHHISVQIASMNGIDLEGEDVCYMNGDIAQYLYPLCRPLIT